MLNKINIFFNSKNFYRNLKKTEFFFKSLISDIENFEIPLLQSYERNYIFDFSPTEIPLSKQLINIKFSI